MPGPPLPPAAGAAESPASNVLPFGRTVSLGDALAAVDIKLTPPAAELADDDDDDLEAAPPAAYAGPPATESPPAALTPDDDEDPDSFAQLAGKVATSVGVAVLTSVHRRAGREPNELDEDEVERLEVETTKAVRRGIGDRSIPWWAPVVSAWGMAYFSMGNGARLIGSPPADQLVPEASPPSSSPPRPTPPAPPGPPPRSTPGPYIKPPPVTIIGSAPRVA